jgi:hypothetical protein
MPSDLIVAMFDGMGGLVVLDSSQVNQEGEYPGAWRGSGMISGPSRSRCASVL